MELTIPAGTMILFVGIQASGKTSFYRAEFPQLVHVSLDELHTRNKERLLIRQCLENGISFVVDNTNPTAADRAGYITNAKKNGFAVYGFYFQSSVSESIDRNGKRNGTAQVPRNAIAHTHRILQLPAYEEGFDKLFYVSLKDGQFIVDTWEETEKKDEV